MANGRNKGGAKIDFSREPGGFVALPWKVLDSVAYQGLSHVARSLLLEVARQYVRDNNGRLLLSTRYMRARGWRSADVINRAKRQLLDAGLIFETFMGHRPNKASWYALTWYSLDWHPGFDPGTKETFRRGMYAELNKLSPSLKMNRRPCRKEDEKNESLVPPHGSQKVPIVPVAGKPDGSPSPSHGTVLGSSAQVVVPSHGNHLEKPSAQQEINPKNPSVLTKPNVNKGRWMALRAARENSGIGSNFGKRRS
jgi:hypothetical protein